MFSTHGRVPLRKETVALLVTEIASDGSPTPYRMHMRAPSFANIQCLPHMMRGGLVADAVAVISSVDPVLGDVDR